MYGEMPYLNLFMMCEAPGKEPLIYSRRLFVRDCHGIPAGGSVIVGSR